VYWRFISKLFIKDITVYQRKMSICYNDEMFDQKKFYYSENLKKRLVWIDIAKGIGILSVVLYHTGFLPFQKQFLPLITSYMLPLFCVVGGYVFAHQRDCGKFVIKKIQSLVVPYLVFGIISYVFWFILIHISNYQIIQTDAGGQFIQFLLGKNLIFNGPLWFLIAFFSANVIYNVIYPYAHNKSAFKQVGFAFFLWLISYFMNPSKMHYVYSFDLVLCMASILLLGDTIRNNWEKIVQKKIIMICLPFFFVFSLKNGVVDMYGRIYGNLILFWCNAIVGSFIILFLSLLIAKKTMIIAKILEYLGKRSLLVLVTHWPIMQWTTYLLKSIGVLNLINGKPGFASFSYFISNKYVFTLVEIPLLIIYTLVPILFVLLLDKSKTCVLKYVQV